VRDTSRRGALDEAWAATHPVAPPKTRANPIEKLGSKGCGCVKKAEPAPPTQTPKKRSRRQPSKPKDAITGRTYDRMPRETGESVYTYARRLVTEASSRIGEGHHRVAEELLVEAGRVAAKLSSSKATRVHTYADQIRARLPRSSSGELAQADKDQLLLGAFQQAIEGALR
jgi:hypothetical protein